jgi:dihydrolipoamide dehydrogenase
MKEPVAKVIHFKNCIIAAGSQAVGVPFMPEDPRVVGGAGALELKEVPKCTLTLVCDISWRAARR